MTDKRSASQQRRAKQNRNARQSLAARRAAAAEKADSADSDGGALVDDDTEAVSPDEVTEPGAGRARGGSRSRTGTNTRGGRPLRRPSPVPDTGSGLAGWWGAVREVRGGLFAFASFLLAIVVGAIFGFVVKIQAIVQLTSYLATVAKGQRATGQLSQKSFVQLFGAPAIVVVASPVLIIAAGLAAVRRPERRRAWFYCSLALGMWLFILQGFAIVIGGIPLGLIIAGLFWFGTYQNAKAERALE